MSIAGPIQSIRSDLRFLGIIVVALLIFRLVLAAAFPLLDRTEARYSEIARIMVETNEWVVPQIDYGNPFWAKPPLSIWLTAMSFNIFGVNELAARLPAFLLSVLTIFILGNLVVKSGTSFYVLAFVLITTPQFLIHAGVVSTDATLGFCIVMAMVSFWQTVTSQGNQDWRYWFFIFIGLGLLAKGPLMIALTIPPIVIWSTFQKDGLSHLVQSFSWVSGILIVALVALPWYVLMELQSPGFLNYLIIGEHLSRFMQSGWDGDRYGSTKSQPIGMVWIFLMVFAFPWIQVVLFWLLRNRKSILLDRWATYLLVWLFWTPVFFTFSKHIMHTYIIPVLAPIALLVCHAWEDLKYKKLAIRSSLAFPVLALVAFIGFSTGAMDFYLTTDKHLLADEKFEESDNQWPVYYWKQKSYSGQFYSKGQARVIKDWKSLQSLMNHSADGFYVVIAKNDVNEICRDCLSRLTAIRHTSSSSIYVPKVHVGVVRRYDSYKPATNSP